MTSHGPRPLKTLLVSVILLGSAGCGSTVEPSKGASTATQAASAAPVEPTARPTSTASAEPTTAGPIVAAQARNPAAMDGAVPYRPAIDPSSFVETIDNPYWPLTPGTSFEYKGGGEQIKVDVTSERRVVMGVSTVVVRDQAFVDGKLIEDTDDWFAQDRAGNVWYFGEATTSYEDDPAGSTAGSWEAGVDGAQPGVVMLADPMGGDVYRQEFYAGEAEDLALVRHPNGVLKVPAGSFKGLLVTEEWTPLEPDTIELKYYARGIGLIAEQQILGGKDLVELVRVTRAGS